MLEVHELFHFFISHRHLHRQRRQHMIMILVFTSCCWCRKKVFIFFLLKNFASLNFCNQIRFFFSVKTKTSLEKQQQPGTQHAVMNTFIDKNIFGYIKKMWYGNIPYFFPSSVRWSHFSASIILSFELFFATFAESRLSDICLLSIRHFISS